MTGLLRGGLLRIEVRSLALQVTGCSSCWLQWFDIDFLDGNHWPSDLCKISVQEWIMEYRRTRPDRLMALRHQGTGNIGISGSQGAFSSFEMPRPEQGSSNFRVSFDSAAVISDCNFFIDSRIPTGKFSQFPRPASCLQRRSGLPAACGNRDTDHSQIPEGRGCSINFRCLPTPVFPSRLPLQLVSRGELCC